MKENEFENIGEYIRSVRNEKGMSINELVKQSGVSKGYISQIENNKFNPSLDIVRKISNALDADFYELAYLAGHFTEHEKEEARYFHLASPEELQNHREADFLWQIKQGNIMAYQEKRHVRIEDFFQDKRKSIYIADHKLTDEEIRMLITLFDGKEKNYPSDEQLEKEYEEIKRIQEENKMKVEKGEAFIIFNDDYDINTNEGE